MALRIQMPDRWYGSRPQIERQSDPIDVPDRRRRRWFRREDSQDPVLSIVMRINYARINYYTLIIISLLLKENYVNNKQL